MRHSARCSCRRFRLGSVCLQEDLRRREGGEEEGAVKVATRVACDVYSEGGQRVQALLSWCEAVVVRVFQLVRGSEAVGCDLSKGGVMSKTRHLTSQCGLEDSSRKLVQCGVGKLISVEATKVNPERFSTHCTARSWRIFGALCSDTVCCQSHRNRASIGEELPMRTLR